MKEEVAIHFESADECIAQAELLYAASHPGAAIGRSYYAMFHAATAALLHRGVERHSHQGIIATFAQTFVKTGRIDARFHRYVGISFLASPLLTDVILATNCRSGFLPDR